MDKVITMNTQSDGRRSVGRRSSDVTGCTSYGITRDDDIEVLTRRGSADKILTDGKEFSYVW